MAQSDKVDADGTTQYTYSAGRFLNTEEGLWASGTVSYTYNSRLRSRLTHQQPTGNSTNGYTCKTIAVERS